MTHRDEYERHLREAAESAITIRTKLSETFHELATRAILERRWGEASAFQLAADLALGTVVEVGEPVPSTRPVNAANVARAISGRTAMEALNAAVRT